MKERHIPFEKISDLYDGNIITQREKTEILLHLEKCEYCQREYNNLRKSLNLLSGIKRLGIINYNEFISGTLEKIRLSQGGASRKTIAFKNTITALAATILIIISVMLFNNRILNYNDDGNFAYTDEDRAEDESDMLDEANLVNNYKFRRILPVLISNNASISKVTGGYIDGEITLYDYQNLINDLYYKDYSKMKVEKHNVNLSEAAYEEEDPLTNYSGVKSIYRKGAIIYFRVDLRASK